jgi:hypothetical protein
LTRPRTYEESVAEVRPYVMAGIIGLALLGFYSILQWNNYYGRVGLPVVGRIEKAGACISMRSTRDQHIDYVYRVDGKEYRDWTSMNCRDRRELVTGEEVTVVYLPEDHAKSHLLRWDSLIERSVLARFPDRTWP